MSLTRLLDVVSNLTTTLSELRFKSNVLNVTTWKNLSNETWTLILRSEIFWIHEYQHSIWRTFNITENADRLVKPIGVFRLFDFVANLASGGDIWQKLRTIHEGSRMKPMLTLVEDMPNLFITAINTFVSSEQLDDFIQKLFVGQLHPCDIDRYLISPSFIRKKSLLSSITNFCQKIVMSDKDLTWTDILSIDGKLNVIV